MALTWTSFDLPITSTVTDVLTEIFANQLQTLTHWQNKGGGVPGATVLFDGGAAGGLLERVSDSKQFAFHFAYSGVTDTFGHTAYKQNGRFATDQLNSTGFLSCYMDNTGSRWANKTDFFGAPSVSMLFIDSSGVTGGPFQRGETITIDAVGDNRTATVDEVINDAQYVILCISGVSGAPSGNWNAKTVTGGTSLASATTQTSGQPTTHWHVGQQDTYDLRSGPDFPGVLDVLTGQTSGQVGTVATADALTGRITVNTHDGRFAVNEIVEWNAGANTATVGWHPRGWDIISGSSTITSDFVVDDTTVLIGEDADRLIFLIPDVAPNLYRVGVFGKWWDSAEGHGRMDGTVCGSAALMFGSVGTVGAGGFIDGNGELFSHRSSTLSSAWQLPGHPIAVASTSTQSAIQQNNFWGNGNVGEQRIDHPSRVVLRTSEQVIRILANVPEFFSLPQETFRTVGLPGSWGGNAPVALHLNDSGQCIEFDNSVITP